jgi:hypothetical protein
MNVDLDRNEISNLLVALNAVQVQGRPNMVTVLRLMEKLEGALNPVPPPVPPTLEEVQAKES